MSLHLDALAGLNEDTVLTNETLNQILQTSNVYESEQRNLLHFTSLLKEKGTKYCIGKFVITAAASSSSDEEDVDIVPLAYDITIFNNQATPVHLLERLPMSSDAQEYYTAELTDSPHRFMLETVSRHMAPDEIEETVQKVYLSAIPLRLGVYKDEKAMNAALGFGVKFKIGGKKQVAGLSSTFLAPGNRLDEGYEPYSIMIGTVQSINDVCVQLGGHDIVLTVMMLDTAFGPLPAAMGKGIFKGSGDLAVGKVVNLYAAIKADFVSPTLALPE